MSRKIMFFGGLPIVCPYEKAKLWWKHLLNLSLTISPLIWMFRSRPINNKINSFRVRALRVVNSDFKSSFEGLLMKGNSFSIHRRSIESLAIEIYKFLDEVSPSILNNVFHKNISNSYDLRNHNELYSRNPKTVRYGAETVSYTVPKIWSKVTETIKMSSSLESFKSKIRKWKPYYDSAFAQNICIMLVSLMLFSFYLFWFR